jgi:hypothetical protein
VRNTVRMTSKCDAGDDEPRYDRLSESCSNVPASTRQRRRMRKVSNMLSWKSRRKDGEDAVQDTEAEV